MHYFGKVGNWVQFPSFGSKVMIETEKKYALQYREFESLKSIFSPAAEDEYIEENTLYEGNFLTAEEVLRIRKITSMAGAVLYVVTYKGLSEFSGDGIKSREEVELSTTSNPAILFKNLGYLPTVSYEKRRIDHHFDQCVLSLDELPFGYYMEIEAKREEFPKLEKHLLDRLKVEAKVEHRSYPQLVRELWGGNLDAKFLG